MTSGPLNRFVGLTWGLGADADILSRAANSTSGWARWGDERRLLAAERADRLSASSAGAVCSSAREIVDLAVRRSEALAQVLERLAFDGKPHPAESLSPIALAWGAAHQACLSAHTDRYGVGQLFYAQKGGVSLVSNSAALVAHIVGAAPSKSSLLAYALFGAYLHDDTPFEGVSKLMNGCEAILEEGRIDIGARPMQPPSTRGIASTETLASDLVDIMSSLSDAYPDADFELSGGVDSRLMLAALPEEHRKRHRYLTIGSPDSEDVQVSSAIARALNLDHVVIDVSDMSRWGAEELDSRFDTAIEVYDYGGNPVDKVALLEANRLFPSVARFSGQNGEILRGFYHPGQDLRAEPSSQLAKQLVNWRLVANDRVSPMLLSRVAREYEAEALERAEARLLDFGGPWGDAIDRFYLYERMQRWVGNSAGILAGDRQVLFPFFERRFVETSLALQAEHRSESTAAFELLGRLDPQLADIELANGVRPSRAAARGLGKRIENGKLLLKRVKTAVERRAFGQRKASLGSNTVIDLWSRRELYRRLPAAALHDLGVFDDARLEQLVKGERRPDRPTLGFLLTCAKLVSR